MAQACLCDATCVAAASVFSIRADTEFASESAISILQFTGHTKLAITPFLDRVNRPLKKAVDKMDLNPKNAELIVGLVARMGVDTSGIVPSISDELDRYGYKVHIIRVTDLIRNFEEKLGLDESNTYNRYKSYIKACNKLRREIGDAVMADLAITDIRSKREQETNDPSNTTTRIAYIINQIKRPEESERFRKVFGEHYVQISCHADESVRISRLQSRIAADNPGNPKGYHWDLQARELVFMDETEENEENGQRVRQVFPLSDIIINANSVTGAEKGIERFFRALFGDNSVTPTREEYGMQLANTAAQRSSDLSRQVGAAILNSSTEIQALGCNEVPRAGGGTYWEGDASDGRDFAIGHDSNEDRRLTVLMDLMLRLKEINALSENIATREDIKKTLFDRKDNVINESQLMDSLEYGRTVHAEMNAITDAARGGHSIRDCTLFSNTFPCHNCAKHIVAAGIAEVVYIHPYPKSYAKELFSDSIEVNPPLPGDQGSDHTYLGRKVIFRQFIGIQGPMYSRVFTKSRWKKGHGKVERFDKTNASYIRRMPLSAYQETEVLLLDDLSNALTAAGYLLKSLDANNDKPTGDELSR